MVDVNEEQQTTHRFYPNANAMLHPINIRTAIVCGLFSSSSYIEQAVVTLEFVSIDKI